MANENKEIGDIVKKCKILLLDIEGTTTSISFVKDKLFPYALDNVKQFLDSQWETEDVKSVVTALRKLALEDKEKSIEGVIAIPGEDVPKEEQIEGLVNNVKWQMSLDRKAGPLKQLQGLIWKQGYDNGDIKGHVYDDVSPALEQWSSVEGQKVYIYSSGSVDAQKLLFAQSTAGDLLKFIAGHFDTAVGAKQEPASYTSIVEKIGCKSDEILFLTDIVNEAEAARTSGLHAALVSRAGNAPLPAPPARPAFLVIHSLQQLAATNKRKPDDVAQDALPAKVPKTDIEDDVKTTSTETESKVAEAEAAPSKSEPEPKKEEEKPEKMDVEEPVTVAEPAKEDKIDDVPMESPVVEEVTGPKEVENVPVLEAKPIIIDEKTEEKETEKIEAEPVKPVETGKANGTAEVKNSDVSAPVAEETPPTIITEIEEITVNQDLAEVDEIIDDLVPVVEEPAEEDMEDLQNVGEVLEKECDEILSKVQDVTNLDNISLKPLLKPIAEETMETENSDTNDIVDRILDSELELEMKQCDEIDLNSVQEITDPKSETVEEKTEKVEVDASDKTNEVDASDKTNEVAVVEQKATEVVEDKNVTDGNAASPTNTETTMEVDKTETVVPETKVSESKEDESMVTEPAEKEVETAKAPEAESKEVPIAKSKEAPQTECKEAPQTECKEAPQTECKEAPQTECKEAPQTECKEAPKTESKEAPQRESEEAPQIESEEAPKTESKETTQSEIKEAPQAEAPVEDKSTPPAEVAVEKKENDKVPEVAPEVKDSEMKEPQVNGKTTNGDAETVNVNGGASNAEELNSRLSVEENGKKTVNGSNGNATEEKGQGDSKEPKEPEAADIKVKSVADVAGVGGEPRTDAIEQPTEA